jgi:nicotinate-nucleotide adenylyltransferase
MHKDSQLLPHGVHVQKNSKIGLFGGSFNPAHDGHLHVSVHALKCLKLDYLVWLVTPQNTLKSINTKHNFQDRVEGARKFVQKYPEIYVSDIEISLNTEGVTADTIVILKEMYPTVNFFWIMGADSITQMHFWERYEKIFNLTKVVVFDRPGYTEKALNSQIAKVYDRILMLPECKERSIEAEMYENNWVFIHTGGIDISSSQIRQNANKMASHEKFEEL